MNNLKTLRKQKKKTQEEVANALGIKQQSYSRIENGGIPSFPVAVKIARYFHKEVDEIFFELKTTINCEER